jgi:cell division septation protein DedD
VPDKTKIIIGWSVVVILVFISASIILNMVNSSANAGGGKIRICHATASDKNPYVSIEVDSSSIENPNDKKYLNGHGDHEKDIIPPFTFGETQFLGRNWDDTGQMIWKNDCSIILPTPSPTPTPTPTEPTPTPTPTEPTPTPTPTEPTPTPTEPTPTPTPTDIPAGGGGMAVKVPSLK